MSSGVPAELPCGGDLTFDRERRTLAVNGRKVVLDTRSALVFQTLSDHFGELVSKDALLTSAWPGQLVHENSLAKAVSRLRSAISGSGLVITATYGHGYTLEKEVAALAVPETEMSPPGGAEQPKRGGTRRMVLALVVILLTVAVAALAVDRTSRDTAIRTTPPLTHDAADAVATILWVDDNPSNNMLEVDYLRDRKIAVHLVESTEDAVKLLNMNSYQLVVSDLGRGEDRLAGLKLARTIKQNKATIPVIIYTIRPDSPSGQAEQKRMVAEAGADSLAVTPAEVRTKIVALLSRDAA